MTFDAGRIRHDGALMHYSRASNGSSIPSNWRLSATGDTGVAWAPESASAVSYGSNSNDVGNADAAGASSLASRADHVHRGVHLVSSNGSNSLYGDVNLQAGTGIALGVAGQSITVTNTGSAGGGGGTTITTKDEGSTLSSAVTTLDFVGAGVTASGAGATTTVTIPGGSGTHATVPSITQGVGSASLNTQNPTLTIAAASSGHTLLLGVNLVGRASTSVTCTNVTWTKVAGPTTSSGGSRYETWVGVVAGGSSGTTITVNTGSSNFSSLVVIEIPDSITVSAGTPYDSDFAVTTFGYFGGLNAPTAGKLVAMMVGVDNTTTAILGIPNVPMVGFSRTAAGTGIAILCGYASGDAVTGQVYNASGTVGHAQIVTVN